MSSEMDLALSPYVHFDSSLDSPMSIPVDPYLPHHYVRTCLTDLLDPHELTTSPIQGS